MPWQDHLNANPLDWLLEQADPGVRYLVLRDLLDRPASAPELVSASQEAHRNGPIAAILDQMHSDGYWLRSGTGYNPKYRSAVWSLTMLAQLGAQASMDERIRVACAYMLEHGYSTGGHFSATGAPSGTIDCLQGNLCWALLELGFADARLESAFEWMARTVTGEGMAPKEDKNAPRRYYAYNSGPIFSCGVNWNQPCGWGATKVMMAFGKLPRTSRTPLVTRAINESLEFLFSTDPARANWPSSGIRKPSPNWWKFGFPVFYVTDLLQVMEALAALGYAKDPRLANTVELILQKQDALGRWPLEYEYIGKTWVDFGVKKQPNKWVTLRALRVMKRVFD